MDLGAIGALIFLGLLLCCFVLFVGCECYLGWLARPRDYFKESKKLDKEMAQLEKAAVKAAKAVRAQNKVNPRNSGVTEMAV